MRISPDYLSLNRAMHEQQSGFGAGGWKWVGPALSYARALKCRSILDYGSGKGTFQKWFPIDMIDVCSFDPATAPTDPKPRDFVICIDVLEHIEPDLLDNVISHLASKTLVAGLLLISTRAATKNLADGRNAHLIIEDRTWWEKKLGGTFASVEDVSLRYPELVRGDEALFLVRV